MTLRLELQNMLKASRMLLSFEKERLQHLHRQHAAFGQEIDDFIGGFLDRAHSDDLHDWKTAKAILLQHSTKLIAECERDIQRTENHIHMLTRLLELPS